MYITIKTENGKFFGKIIKGVLHQQISFVDIKLQRRVWYDETLNTVESMYSGKWKILSRKVESVVYSR